MTRREGGRLAWGRYRVVQGGTGVCRSSAVVVVVALLPACPLKWCKIYEARHPQPPPAPPLSPILLNFIPSGQKWSAESPHCCCCRWCCRYYCCCCSSSCLVIYCLQLPNLFLCFFFFVANLQFYFAAGIPPIYSPIYSPIYTLTKTFLLSFLLSFYRLPPTSSLRFGLQLFRNCFYNTKKKHERKCQK